MKREKIKKYVGVYKYVSETRPRWKGELDVCFHITYKNGQGKKIWEKVGWASDGISAQYASKIRGDRLNNINLGEEVIPIQKRKKQTITFKQLAGKYIKWAKSNKKSWYDDEKRYEKHLAPVLDNYPLININSDVLNNLKSKLERKNLAPATIKHCLVLIRQMFNKASTKDFFGYKGDNPIKHISLPKIHNKRDRYLTHEEAHLLLTELQKVSPMCRDQAILSLHCGLRFVEIATLTWGSINFNNDTILIQPKKGGESRQAYMTSLVKTTLHNRKTAGHMPNDLVFPSRKGTIQKSISNAFDRAVDRLGFNENITESKHKVVFHTLRHTFASWLAIQGTPLFTIQKLLGHKTITMTERYAHLSPNPQIAAVEELANNFMNSEEPN